MSREKRWAVRCPADRNTSALLKWGWKRRQVRLLDQSAEGFSVAVRGRVDLRVGNRPLLCCARGWSETEVANVQSQGGVTRLGLYRLRDLPEDVRIPVTSPFSWWREGVPLGRGWLSNLLIVMLWASVLYWLSAYAIAWYDNGGTLPPLPW